MPDGQCKCGSKMPPSAETNPDGLPWSSLGESLAVFKPQVCNCREHDRLHCLSGAEGIGNGVKERTRAGHWRRWRAIKYVVSHNGPIRGRHTWNRGFQHREGEKLFFPVQVECDRIGQAEILPQAFQLLPAGAGLPLRDLAVKPPHYCLSLHGNRKKLAKLAWGKCGIGNEFRYFSITVQNVSHHFAVPSGMIFPATVPRNSELPQFGDFPNLYQTLRNFVKA